MPGLTKTSTGSNDSTICDLLYDLLVVGLGPAGVACVVQAARDGLRVAAVSDEPPGGLLRAARRLDNFPFFSPVAGPTLAGHLEKTLERLKFSPVRNRVVWLERGEEFFEATLENGQAMRARTVVLATGTEPAPWEFDKGGPLHRDVRTMPVDLSGRKVAVVGGGEAAIDSALSCRDRGADVVLCVRGKMLRATNRLKKEAEQAGLKMEFGCRLERVSHSAGRWRLRSSAGLRLDVDELMVCIGRRPRLELARAAGARPGRDVVARGCRGLFLAGDVIRGRERYAATAMGDGQRAALAAAAYLREAGR